MLNHAPNPPAAIRMVRDPLDMMCVHARLVTVHCPACELQQYARILRRRRRQQHWFWRHFT